jgi:hypothetical protein
MAYNGTGTLGGLDWYGNICHKLDITHRHIPGHASMINEFNVITI